MFRAFCDRTRLRILSLLRTREWCVGDIVTILEAPQPSISRHLAQLKRAGLVNVRRSGLWKHYSLAEPSTVFHSKLLECAISCFREVPEIQADNERAVRVALSSCCCSDASNEEEALSHYRRVRDEIRASVETLP